jgi:hypothetical protein
MYTMSVPAAPTNLSAFPGDGQILVSFTPGSNGGSPITGYKVSVDGGATFAAVSPAVITSPILVKGLANGTAYNIQVMAVNANGNGATSAIVTASAIAGADFNYVQQMIVEMSLLPRSCLYIAMVDAFFIQAVVQAEIRPILLDNTPASLQAAMIKAAFLNINLYDTGLLPRAMAMAYSLTKDTYVTGTTVEEAATSLKALLSAGMMANQQHAGIIMTALDFIINDVTVADTLRSTIVDPADPSSASSVRGY